MTAPINSYPDDEIMLDVPTEILCSYFYFQEIDMGQVHRWGTRIIGDSGAFSALTSGNPVKLEEFHEWAHRWKDDLFWTASLDVIGDAEGTRANWLAAKSDGLNLVPTIHYGATPDDLQWFIDRGADFVGLGGMVPYSSEPDRLMRWLIPLFKHVRDHAPHVRFHGWGISHPRLVDRLPWWSCDSSAFSAVFRFGELRLWVPHKAKFDSVTMNGHDLKRYARVLKTHYGIDDWRPYSVSKSSNRRKVGRLAFRSTQLYNQWLRSRQQVTPPQSLVPALERESALLFSEVFTGPSRVSALGTKDGVVNPDGSVSFGPGRVSALGGDNTLHRYFHGPSNSSALGASAGDNPGSFTPDASLATPKIGPSRANAMGFSEAQPMQSLEPNNGEIPHV